MLLLGLGGNLSMPGFRSPIENFEAVTSALVEEGVVIVRRSSWYRTAPIGAESQPWYINGVAEIATDLPPNALMKLLLATENRFGRVRTIPNAPRTVDLDLLAYGDIIMGVGDGALVLPHPRMHERAFVLVPLVEIAPTWRHPVVQRTAEELLAELPPGQEVERVDAATVADPGGLG